MTELMCWCQPTQMSYFDGGAISFEGTVDYEEDLTIGEWKAVVLPVCVADFVDAADEVSAGALDAAEAWGRFEDELGIPAGHVLVVDCIQINPEMRGQGGGREALRSLIRTVGYGCEAVIIKPHPLNNGPKPMPAKELDEGIKKLTAYWAGCAGFRPMGDGKHLVLDLTLVNEWIGNA